MPNRIIRASILDSDAVNTLSPEAEVFYRRLMSVVDDFGRFDGRPAILRASLYPLRLDAVSEADILKWMKECQTADLLIVYQVDNRPYLLYPKLHKHLTGPRAKESKYPPPPQPVKSQPEIQTDGLITSTCEGVRADARRCSGSASYSDSDTDSDTDSETMGSPGHPSKEIQKIKEFDRIKHDHDEKVSFVSRWNAAGLKPITRLSINVQSLLNSCLQDPWWAEHYPEALIRAGKIPFLQLGISRPQGRLDVFEFVRDPDVVRRILEGCYDPRSVAGKPSRDETPEEQIARLRQTSKIIKR